MDFGEFVAQKKFAQSKEVALCTIENQGEGSFSCHELPNQLLGGAVIDHI